MELQVGIITRFDNDPQADFPHEYSAWADGDPVSTYKASADLSRQKYDGVEQTRTVTSEGLHGPVRGLLTVNPPKYPPVLISAYNCDSSLLASIQSNAQYMILSVDDIGNGVPAVAEDRGMNDPMPDEVFTELSTKIVALTRNVIGNDEADQVDVALASWRASNPQGTPQQFYLRVNRFAK